MLLNGSDLYLAGFTESTDLPGLSGAAQTTVNGGFDTFVARLSADLTSIQRSSYFGGSGFESAAFLNGINGNLYLSGFTQSTDLPNVAGSAQPVYGGGTPIDEVADGFIALFAADLGSVTRATYYGGSGFDAVVLSPQEFGNNLLLGGSTNSTDLPGTAGAAQPEYGGGTDLGDAVAALISPDLTTLVRSTYIGGSGDDSGGPIFTPSGDLIAGGVTNSSDFPGVAGGIQDSYGGAGSDGLGDVWVARLAPDLTSILQATYYGGSGDDSAAPLFLPSGSNMYLIGDTTSPNLIGTAGGAQEDHANTGSNDMFLALISADLTGDGGNQEPPPPTGPIFAAALPGQRVATVGGPGVTFFGTIINSGSETAVDCSLAMDTFVAGAAFSYQTTDAQNVLTGNPNTPADIPAGASQSYLFTITPSTAFPPTEINLAYDCINTDPAAVTPGVNTVNVLASDTALPDVVAIALTPTGDGIAHIPGATGSTAFAMATVNVGASGDITVTADTGSVDLGVTIALCQTNPGDGSCIEPPSNSVTLTMGSNATPTFSFFVTGSQVIPLDPAVNRLNIRFQADNGGSMTQVGQSSVALWTNPS